MTQILNSELSRRSVLQGAAAAGVPAVLSKRKPRRPGGSDRSATDLPFMPAAQAESLAASIGVVTHLHFTKTVYGQTDRVVDAVTDLGVRHVRNRIGKTDRLRAGFAELARRGVNVQGVCGEFGDSQTMFEVFDEVIRSYPDPAAIFSAFEGINEPNNNGVPWIDETRAQTRALFLQRNARGLSHIPIVAPALARVPSGGAEGRDTEQQSANLGDLSEYVDFGNIHVYPRGLQPSTDINAFMRYQREVCGDAPIMCTEGGYFTAKKYKGGAFPVSPGAAGTYLPRQIMEHWTRGNERFFVYSLLDEYDRTQAYRPSNFGLLEVTSDGPGGTWTPKPHYYSIKNFVKILGDRGEAHDVGGMNLSVKGIPDLRTALVAKRNGARYLAMWRDVLCFEPRSRRSVHTKRKRATVTLPEEHVVKLYHPSQSHKPTDRLGRVSSFTVPVQDELVICKIR